MKFKKYMPGVDDLTADFSLRRVSSQILKSVEDRGGGTGGARGAMAPPKICVSGPRYVLAPPKF